MQDEEHGVPPTGYHANIHAVTSHHKQKQQLTFPALLQPSAAVPRSAALLIAALLVLLFFWLHQPASE